MSINRPGTPRPPRPFPSPNEAPPAKRPKFTVYSSDVQTNQLVSYTEFSWVDRLKPNDDLQQQNIGDCYLVAALTTLLASPECMRLFQRINVTERTIFTTDSKNKTTTYCDWLTPSGDTISVKKSRVGKKKGDLRPVKGPWIIQLVERLFGKLRATHQQQQSKQQTKEHSYSALRSGRIDEALHTLLGGTIIPNFDYQTHTAPLLEKPDYETELETYLNKMAQDQDHVYLLGANTPQYGETDDLKGPMQLVRPDGQTITISRKHACAITAFDTDKKTITVADPHDTANKVYTLTYAEFCQLFNEIAGVKIPKSELQNSISDRME